MKSERGPEGDVKAPKKRPGASSKKPEVPAGLEHYTSKYPKPTHSYSLLITTAIMESAQNQMTLNEIYEWVMDRYPWYRTAINGWKVSCCDDFIPRQSTGQEEQAPLVQTLTTTIESQILILVTRPCLPSAGT